MKKITHQKLFFLTFSLIFVIGSVSYLNFLKDNELYQLRKDVNAVEYPLPYIFDTFDCSEMSGLMCDYLDSKGWDAYIFITMKHAYVVVYGKADMYFIECTGERSVSTRPNPNMYHFVYVFNTTRAAEFCLPGQFDYWNIEVDLPIEEERR